MSDTLRIKRGDTWRPQFVWQDGSGNPIDLTGATARLQLRQKREQIELSGTSYPAELDLKSTEGDIVITESEGKLEVEASATQTSSLEPKNYVTDVEITFPNGDVRSTQTIDVIVERDVTHD